jgi:hypothetical protein
VHSVKEQLFNYIVLCFIKLQILARISTFSLLRSQYNFCSGLRTWKFWQILLILLNISVLITGHVEHDIRKCFSSSISPDVQRRQNLSCRRAPWYRLLSICNLCDEIRNLVKFLLCSKDFNIHKYFSSPKYVLNLYEIYSNKLQWPNTFFTSLYMLNLTTIDAYVPS